MDSNDWGYDPLKTIADQAEFIKKLAGIVGMDWHNANVWRRHAELEQRIATLAARTQPAPLQAEARPQWIECAKQMPPPDAELLVVWGDHRAVDTAHTYSKWNHPTHPLGYLIKGHGGSHNMVTHWMLKPAAPQPKEQSNAVCRSDGKCQYAIDHDAEKLGHCPTGKCVMPRQAETALQPKGGV